MVIYIDSAGLGTYQGKVVNLEPEKTEDLQGTGQTLPGDSTGRGGSQRRDYRLYTYRGLEDTPRTDLSLSRTLRELYEDSYECYLLVTCKYKTDCVLEVAGAIFGGPLIRELQQVVAVGWGYWTVPLLPSGPQRQKGKVVAN